MANNNINMQKRTAPCQSFGKLRHWKEECKYNPDRAQTKTQIVPETQHNINQMAQNEMTQSLVPAQLASVQNMQKQRQVNGNIPSSPMMHHKMQNKMPNFQQNPSFQQNPTVISNNFPQNAATLGVPTGLSQTYLRCLRGRRIA